MFEPKRDFRRPAILAVIFLVIYVGANLFWLDYDTLPPPFDQSAHGLIVLKYHQLLDHPVSLSGTKLLRGTNYWPPFFYFSSAIATQIFGFSPDTIVLTNFFFLLLLALALFKLGETLFNSWVGFLTVLLSLMCPLVYALLRDGLIDFSLLTIVVVVQYLIIKSRGGQNLKLGLLLGLAMAAALLTKWTSPIFFAFTGPLVFLVSGKREPRPLWRALGHGIIVVMIALALALPWYVKNYHDFRSGAQNALYVDSKLEGDPTRFWPSLIWYLAALKDVLISRWLLPFFLGGWAAFFLWSRNWLALSFSLAWFFPSLLIFILIPNKDARFILPLLPSLALLSSAGLNSIPWKRTKLAVVIALIIIASYQFSAISFGWPKFIEHPYTHRAVREDWQVDKILAGLKTAFPEKELRLAVLANQPYFNPNLFHFYGAVQAPSFKIDSVGDRPLNFTQLTAYHFLILKTGDIALEHTARHRRAFLSKFWPWLEGENKGPSFILWGKWPLPDGSEALVYQIEK